MLSGVHKPTKLSQAQPIHDTRKMQTSRTRTNIKNAILPREPSRSSAVLALEHLFTISMTAKATNK